MILNFDLECPFCGEHEYIELLDAWDTGEFLFTTCCEDSYEECVEAMRLDPSYRDRVLRELGVEEVFNGKLRRVADCVDEGNWRLDFNPEIKPIEQRQAKDFVNQHHAHNRAPAGWRYGAGIWNGAQLIGVLMVGRPVARAVDAATTVEVNRLCLRRDVPRELRWNACSMAYGWAAREAKKRGFAKIITYTLEEEAGTTLKAAGWTPEATTKGGTWHCPSRPRNNTAPTCRKVRWSRQLQQESRACT